MADFWLIFGYFFHMRQKYVMIIQYASAVILIISSIILAYIQVISIDDIADGTLMYIAQAFLLAGSIFGLEYYITKLNRYIDGQQKHSHKATNT